MFTCSDASFYCVVYVRAHFAILQAMEGLHMLCVLFVDITDQSARKSNTLNSPEQQSEFADTLVKFLTAVVPKE